MKRFVFIPILLLLLSSSKCDKPVFGEKFYNLSIKNNSDKLIYCILYDEQSELQYPDTSLSSNEPHLIDIDIGEKYIFYSYDNWDEVLQKLPSDTISIFFISDSIFKNVEWEVLSNQYLILNRYDLSINDLERIGFNVVYPPHEQMAGIKMYDSN